MRGDADEMAKEGAPGTAAGGVCAATCAEGAEVIALDDEAEIGAGKAVRAGLHGLEAGVAVGEEGELDGVAEGSVFAGIEAEVVLEGDEGVVAAGGAGVAAEIVLAGGEEDGVGGDHAAGGEAELPVAEGGGEGGGGSGEGGIREIFGVGKGLGTIAAEDGGTEGGGELEEGLVQGEAGEGDGGERKGGLNDGAAGGEADGVDGDGTEAGGIEAEGAEVDDGLGGEEVAADLVARKAVLLDERDGAAAAGEQDAEGGAGEAAANDERLQGHGSVRRRRGHRRCSTQRREGRAGTRVAEEMPASASRACQSAGRKARRRETGPSCRQRGS